MRHLLTLFDLSDRRDPADLRDLEGPEGQALRRHSRAAAAGPRAWRCCSRSRRCGRASASRRRWPTWAARRCSWATTSAGASARSAADFAAGAQPVRRCRSCAAPTATRRVEELASYCTCPVINGLTDYAHPCQALADLFTLDEIHGPLAGQAAGLRRRRQQRRPQPGDRLRQAGRRVRHRLAAGSISSTGRSSSSWHAKCPT